MMAYRNEAAFSNALVKAMRAKGWFVQRIESGTTGKGIPDMYVIDNRKTAWWVELKREHCMWGPNGAEIHWRPGQQAWLNEIYGRGQHCVTLCCFDNGILQIPHHMIYGKNYVHPDVHSCKFSKDIKDLLKNE